MFLRTHCCIPKVFINQSGFFFCHNIANHLSNHRSKSIPNQNYFPTKFNTSYRNWRRMWWRIKKKFQRFFDNGFPHKPKFPFNELFLNVSNCFPCGIYLFDKYFPCGIKPMRLLWETLNHSRKVSFASCGRICPKSLFWERSNDSNIVRFPKDGGINLSRY